MHPPQAMGWGWEGWGWGWWGFKCEYTTCSVTASISICTHNICNSISAQRGKFANLENGNFFIHFNPFHDRFNLMMNTVYWGISYTFKNSCFTFYNSNTVQRSTEPLYSMSFSKNILHVWAFCIPLRLWGGGGWGVVVEGGEGFKCEYTTCSVTASISICTHNICNSISAQQGKFANLENGNFFIHFNPFHDIFNLMMYSCEISRLCPCLK